MVKAIALIRTSTDRQEIESQKEQVLQMCYYDGLTDDEIIIVGKQGASAIKVDDAYLENMNKVYELIENYPTIKTVYVWAIDRIGRTREHLSNFRETLLRKKVQLIIKTPYLKLLNEDGSENVGVGIAFSVFIEMAIQEMQQKVERFKRGRERNRKQGKWNGGPRTLYGYKIGENKFMVPDEYDAKIVREIYEEYATGKWSIRKLREEMNNRGYERNGMKLTFETVKTCLYNGLKYCGKDDKTNFPPILSEDIVNKVNEQLKKNVRIQKSLTHHYFAHGIFRCSCGKRMVICHDHYRCITSTATGKNLVGIDSQCTAKYNNMSLRVLDGILWRVAKDCHERVLDEMNSNKKKELKKEKNILEKKINKFNKDLESFKDKREKLFERSILEGISQSMVDNIKMKLDSQENKIRTEYNECIEKLNRLNATLNMGENKRRDNEIKFLTMLNLDMTGNEEEMNDLVHKYISNGSICKYEGEPIKGYEGWKTTEVNIDTIFGKRRFIYFPYAKGRTKNVFEELEDGWDWFVYEDVVRDKESCKLVLRNYRLDD